MKRRLGETGPAGSGKGSKVRRIMSSLPDRMLEKVQTIQEARPDCTLKEHVGVAMEYPSFSDLSDFFHAPTQAEIDAYQHDILTAVRTSQIDTLRDFHAQGRPMKCSNEFGESILHLACRKGLVEVARFLVEEAGVPVQVCDDYGRNPLHDACWVHTPNFELMDVVLSKSPDLLFIKDRRGHTPLGFARRDQWKAWNDYIKNKPIDFLKPRQLLSRSSSCTLPNEVTPSPAATTTLATETPATITPITTAVVVAGHKMTGLAVSGGIKISSPLTAASAMRLPTSGITLSLPFPSPTPAMMTQQDKASGTSTSGTPTATSG
jgi:Ankyrin repeats (3 copies)